MPTYADNAKRREVLTRRRAQDQAEAERHRAFDLMAQDRRVKSERLHFAVVGEGSSSSQEAYRVNYERIFGLPSRRPSFLDPSFLRPSRRPADGEAAG